MKKNKLLLFCLTFLLISKNSFSQKINWNFIADSLTLSPNRISGKGDISINNKSTSYALNGSFTFLLNDEILFFKDSLGLYKLKYSEIENVQLENGDIIPKSLLNNKNSKDSILLKFRKSIYKKLLLNEIEILFSEENKYVVSDFTIKVKNPLYLKGKICQVGFYNLFILTEEGELLKINDGDFINIIFENKKYLECRDLYQMVFDNYSEDLKKLTNYYDSLLKISTIDDLVKFLGPYEKILNLPKGNKLYVWDKPKFKEILDLRTSSNLFTNSNTYFPNFNKGSNGFLMFNYANSMLSSFGSSWQTGSVTTINEAEILSLTVDDSGKIINVYQERIFPSIKYGVTIKFIHY